MTEREILICTNTDTVWQRFNEHIWNLYLYNMPQKFMEPQPAGRDSISNEEVKRDMMG